MAKGRVGDQLRGRVVIHMKNDGARAEVVGTG